MGLDGYANPTPATLELVAMAGAPLVADRPMYQGAGELTTPTGAALITTLATFERPAMSVTGIGVGLGAKDHQKFSKRGAGLVGGGGRASRRWDARGPGPVGDEPGRRARRGAGVHPGAAVRLGGVGRVAHSHPDEEKPAWRPFLGTGTP